MERTFFDNLDAFLNLKQRRLFSASVQATYFAILTEFYRQGFPQEISMTVRELGEKAGLKSSETVHVAKNILKNNGLIDFQTVGRQARRTIFTLVCPNVWANNLPNNLPNSESGAGLISYTPVQENGGGSTLPLPPTPPIPNPKKQQEQLSNAEQSLAEQSSEKDIVELWEEMTGKPLVDDANQFLLRCAEDLHGREMVKVAITEYVRGKGKHFKYFEAILKSLAGRLASLKGGGQDGQDSQKVLMDRRVGGERGDESSALGTSETAGKGRFDDEPEPDYDWIHTKQSDNPESEG